MGRTDLKHLIRVDDLMTIVSNMLEHSVPPTILKEQVRAVIDQERLALLNDQPAHTADELAKKVCTMLEQAFRPHLRRVVNATGIVIHTNLGRSVLAPQAVDAIVEVARGYSTLEYQIEQGIRGSRHDHVAQVITKLTGGEDAVVVNNNASAVLLVLAALSAGGEAIISRGQLVEIGGSFRIPDIMRCSQTTMCEVGCTNKTHLSDYADAIGDQTRLIVKVHPSNFKMLGFVDEPDAASLAQLAHQHHLPLYEDQGSGALFSLDAYGLPIGNTVKKALESGVDVVSFSGDKLLGGPQAGIIVGSRELIARIKAHPFMRAMRPDKLTLAALEATLRLSLDEDQAITLIPTLSMLTSNNQELRERAEELHSLLDAALDQHPQLKKLLCTYAVTSSISHTGGGALPEHELHGYALNINVAPGVSLDQLHAALRNAPIPVIACIHHDALIFDTRTLMPGDHQLIIDALIDALAHQSPNPSTTA